MDPTSLPTDNLYKFMALAGLALAGFCVWLTWRIMQFRYQEVAQMSEELARRSRRLAGLSSRLARLQHSNEQFGIGAREAKNDETSHFYANMLKDVHERTLQTEREVASLGEDVAVSEAQVRNAKEWRSRLAPVMVILVAVFGIGLAISVLGFEQWYDKLQRFTDRQTKADFEDHMQQLEVNRVDRYKKAACKVNPCEGKL